jgi:hypothetical protein
MKTLTTRMIAAIAFAAACGASTPAIGVSVAGAQPPALAVESVDAALVEWEFEFAATWYAELSCYFENLDRSNAHGPYRFVGRGKNRDAAERDAWNNAQMSVPRGQKLKHCRTVNIEKG